MLGALANQGPGIYRSKFAIKSLDTAVGLTHWRGNPSISFTQAIIAEAGNKGETEALENLT